MADLQEVRALYEAYLDKAAQVVRDRKPGQGIFGLPGGPSRDPCHNRFAEDLQALLTAYAGEDHSPGETRELLAYIYAAPLAHRDMTNAYWMLLAVHGEALPLIEGLTPEDAAAMAGQYAVDYPRRDRFPVQKQTLAALKKRAK